MHTFEIQVTPDMTRRAWNAWLLARGSHWKLALAALLVIGGAWADVKGDWSRPLSPLSIITLSGMALVIVFFITVYIVGLRHALARLARLPEGRCTYTLTDTAIEATTAHSTTSSAWHTLTEIIRARDILRLHFTPGGVALLPIPQIPPAALTYLVDHARTHGAKVTGM